jgi:uncharacterized protein YpuA (DUF1002 family)
MIFPTLKAACAVIGFIFSMALASYVGINKIAEAQGQVVESKMMAVRNADFQHVTGRFDRIDSKLDKIMELVKNK